MYVRGKGVEFVTVSNIVERVSAELYGGRYRDGEVMAPGNIGVHPDAAPIGSTVRIENVDGLPSWVRRPNGYGFRGRIIGDVTDGPGTRRSASGRRGKWACWHAYGDVMLGIFRVYPHATITTARARYEGMRGFLDTFPRTADVNVGSMFCPAYMPDLCDCTHDELSVTADDYRIANG